jgi:hypothetical protein
MAWLRDLLRGYSDADVAIALQKLQQARAKPPGSFTAITTREFRAIHKERLHEFDLYNGAY